MALSAVGERVRQGKEIETYELAVTATVVVPTKFATIDNVQVTQKRSTAPGVATSVYTWNYSAGVLTVYAWKVTSSADNTLIAGTVSSTVSVTVVGRRRQ